MIKLLENLGIKKFFFLILVFLIATDIVILLNIPFLRQIFGFLFLNFLPGLFILQILRLNEIGSTEIFILTIVLSISFLMFFGLLLNNLSLGLGYKSPLSTVPLLASFNLAAIALTIVAYRINKNATFFLPNLNLSTSEKAFLIVPAFFPALSVFGMRVMNTTDNNIILMFLLFLIPLYIAFVCFFNRKFPKRLYPIVIFLISISLLLLLSLRSNHLIGVDTLQEYYFFRTTLSNLHWSMYGHSALDACLVISLLPTIYQSILNISPEFLFKILYSLLYSISPLVIYVISKKYVEEGYAFLASCFYMFQVYFLITAIWARSNTAILFFALAMMILFSDKMDPLKKRILFIVFMASGMVSHYSTTYIFFFVMFGSFLGIEILSRKYTFKKIISVTTVILFFALIFFWYSQVTEEAFDAGVGFIEDTISNLNRFFIEESRSSPAQALLGKDIMQKSIPCRIEFVYTWMTFAFIGIGIITLIRRYKNMSFPELKFKKLDFLKENFEVGYFVIALAYVGLLITVIAVPYVSEYSLTRSYPLGIVVLSIFFVIGGIILSKTLSLNLLRKVLSKMLRRKKALPKKQKERGKEDGSQVWAYLVILLVLVPYFLCATGVMYNIFGVPRAIILNSEGEQCDQMLIHEQDAYAAKWFGKNYVKEGRYAAYIADGGGRALRTQCLIPSGIINHRSFSKHEKIDGYIHLRYHNVVEGLVGIHNMTEYADMFVGKNMIYTNGGSEVWR